MDFCIVWREESDSDWYQQEFRSFEDEASAVEAWSDVWNLDRKDMWFFEVEER